MLYPLSYEGLRVDPSCVTGVRPLGPLSADEGEDAGRCRPWGAERDLLDSADALLSLLLERRREVDLNELAGVTERGHSQQRAGRGEGGSQR